MRLRLNSVSNNSLRTKKRENIISNIFNSSKKNFQSSQENLTTFKSNYENLNTVNMNNYTALEYINKIFKEKKKINRPINSASFIKSRNEHKKDKLQNTIFSIKQIHQFVLILEKKYNLFNETKNRNETNHYFFSSMLRQNKNNKNKFFYNHEKTQNDSSNYMRNKKNKELIPYPFKRLQKRMRNFFSLSKIKYKKMIINNNPLKMEFKSNIYNDNIINNNIIKNNNINNDNIINIDNNINNKLENKHHIKVLRIKNNKPVENQKKEERNIYRNKIVNIINNHNNKKKLITKKDKSVSTDNLLLLNNNNNYENKNKNSLFNNKLIAYLTRTMNNKNNINNISNINKNRKSQSSRSIFVHHTKSY